MSINGNGNNPNGNGHSSAVATTTGVATNTTPYRSSGAPQQPTADDKFGDGSAAETAKADAPPTEPPNEKQGKRIRRKIIAGLMLVVLCAGVGRIIYVRFIRETRVDYNAQEEQHSARETGAASTQQLPGSPDSTTKEAIADAQNSITSTPPGTAETPGTNGTTTNAAASGVAPTSPATASVASPLILPPDVAGTVTTTTPVTGREEETARSMSTGSTTKGTSDRATAVTTTTSSSSNSSSTPSRRNTERSIFMTEGENPAATTRAKPSAASSRRSGSSSVEPDRANSLDEQPESQVVQPIVAQPRSGSPSTAIKPSFGSMLPVRTLGAIYTLRSGSLVRMELTRDVAGNGWAMRRGTVLVGTLRGSEYDRAYFSLIGFLDPASGRLAKVGGDVLGSDGGAGLRGKRRRIDSRFARVLGQVANSAIGITQSALAGRNNGTTIIMPGVQGALSPELNALSRNGDRREFVEVAAGANGFVLVTDLPREINGVDALAQMDGETLAQTLDTSNLSEAELAELLSTGSPAQIRQALPKMTPEMRRIAEALLNQTEGSKED